MCQRLHSPTIQVHPQGRLWPAPGVLHCVTSLTGHRTCIPGASFVPAPAQNYFVDVFVYFVYLCFHKWRQDGSLLPSLAKDRLSECSHCRQGWWCWECGRYSGLWGKAASSTHRSPSTKAMVTSLLPKPLFPSPCRVLGQTVHPLPHP